MQTARGFCLSALLGWQGRIRRFGTTVRLNDAMVLVLGLDLDIAATWPKKEMVPLRTPAGADDEENDGHKFDLHPYFP